MPCIGAYSFGGLGSKRDNRNTAIPLPFILCRLRDIIDDPCSFLHDPCFDITSTCPQCRPGLGEIGDGGN